MKLMKKFKSGLIGLGLVIPIASVGGVVASCGKKENPPAKPTFGDFTKAAKAEKLVNIVAQTKPKDWVNLPDGDLTAGTFAVVKETIVVSITSKSKEQIAVFTATYVKDTAYNVNSWKSSDPVHTFTWEDFKKDAEGDKNAANIFSDIKQAAPNNVNIDLARITDLSLKLDVNSSSIKDNDKDTVTLSLSFTKGTSMPFDIAPTNITLTIKWTGVAYDIKNWTSDYTFAEFTTSATASVSTYEWKHWIITQADPSWTEKTALVGAVTIKDTTISVPITHTNDDESKVIKTATLKFHNENNKVWIYGEQMGDADSLGGWKIAKPPVNWQADAKKFILKANNNTDNTASQALIGQINNSKDQPEAHANLDTFFAKYTDIKLLKVAIDSNSFNDIPATGRVPEKLTFNMVFYLISDTDSKTPLTSGGVFQIMNTGDNVPTLTFCGVNKDINPLPKLNLLVK